MIYPDFLKKNDQIGITALSSGANDSIQKMKISLNHLKEDYKLIVTPNVYGNEIVSSSIEERVKEFNELLDEDLKMIYIARGGNFLYETIPYLDYKKVKEKRIWIQGFSDPSNLLYILTTKYDLATIYGMNGKGYDDINLLDYQKENLEIIQGKLFHQESFPDHHTKSLNGTFSSSGRIIGGCLDVIRYLLGTEYDNTLNFIEKYHNDKIIWFFDIYAMSAIDTYLTLLELKNIGWFKYTDTILFGEVLFPKEENLLYSDGFKKLFSDKNIVYDANIGHVKPSFTIINGSYTNVSFENNKLNIDMELK